MEILPQALMIGVILAGIYALVALGLTMIFGVLDVVNFSHGQLVTLGAYLIYQLAQFSVNFWLAIPLVMIMLGAVGWVMEAISFRPVRAIPINGLLVSIGWIAIFSNIFSIIWGPNQHTVPQALSGSLTLGPISVSWNQMIVLVVSVVTMSAVALFLRHTRLGKELRAAAQNREAATLMGISVKRMDSLAFAIGAALAGLAGALLANLYPIDHELGASYMALAFVALIIGGAGSAVGAVVGALIVGIAMALAQVYGSTAIANVAPFIVLIAVLLFRPKGIFKTDYEHSL